jgi:hypothetical protein
MKGAEKRNKKTKRRRSVATHNKKCRGNVLGTFRYACSDEGKKGISGPFHE